jgi:hypothetical protein
MSSERIVASHSVSQISAPFLPLLSPLIRVTCVGGAEGILTNLFLSYLALPASLLSGSRASELSSSPQPSAHAAALVPLAMDLPLSSSSCSSRSRFLS